MLECEQLMAMPVSSVVSADGSCCTWALPTATAEEKKKGESSKPALCPAPPAVRHGKSQPGTFGHGGEKSSQRMSTGALTEVSVNGWQT